MKITLKLDTASINNAYKAVQEYQKKVEALPKKLVSYLVEQGVEIAKINVSDMNAIDSGALYRSIAGEARSNVGFVRVGAAHAAFVEFGTGVTGSRSQHPDIAIAGWKYDVNGHGELGWWYVGSDGKAHWTKGMPSRPYMYQTAKALRQMVAPAAKELLK